MSSSTCTERECRLPALKSMAELVQLLDPYLSDRTWPKDRVLWNEGDRDGRLVVITSGRVKIVRISPAGKSILMFVFGPGDVFGFLPFIDGGPYPATTVTMDEVRARVMSRARLREVLREKPDLALKLLAVLGLRLREAFGRIEELSGRDAVTRTAAALVSLFPADIEESGLDIVTIPGPAYGFADEIGITPETFSRTLARLEKAGIIHRLGGGRLQLLDAATLRAAAAGRWTCPV